MRTLNKQKLMVKVVTLFLIQSFIGWNVASAAISDRSLWHQRGKLTVGTSVSANSLVQEDLQKSLFSDFFVPENAGTINELWVPAGMTTKDALSSSKLLIHIRDAHCNYEAQGNIAKVIDNFAKSNGVNFVAVEGAEGKIDYSFLNAFPDYKVRADVTDAFMELGRLCGAEFANINAENYFTLYGAERDSVYNSNLDNFRATLKFKEEGLKFVGQIKSALATLKTHMFTPELKDIEEKLALYNNREISFVDYCQYLYNLPAAENVRTGYKNFALLTQAIRAQELVDFSQIDSEKTAFINELAKSLSAEELSDLSQATLDFQRGKMATAAYYQMLQEMAAAKKIDLASYKNLKPYMLYLNVYAQINSSELFKEKETLEAEVKRSLFKNLDQARLDKLSKNADILEKIFSVRLTNDDLVYFKNNRTDFTAYEFESFVNEHAPKYNVAVNIDFSADPLEKYLTKLEAFYDEAKTRDDLLVQNALSQMELEGANVGVLVAGGFHTAGMTAYLRSKSIPYMIVTPRILKEDVNNPYLKLISGEALPVEKLLTVEHLFGLAVKINDKVTQDTIAQALGTNPDVDTNVIGPWVAEGIAKKLIPAGEYKQYTIEGVGKVGYAVIAGEAIVVVEDNAEGTQFLTDNGITVTATLPRWKVARAPVGKLKGVIADKIKKAVTKAADATVVAAAPLESVLGGKFADFYQAVLGAFRGLALPVPVTEQELNQVVLKRGIGAPYAYEGLPAVDLTPAEALVDQQVVIYNPISGKVEASRRHLVRLAAYYAIGYRAAAAIAAAKLAHDLVEAKLLAQGVSEDDAHARAVQQIDKPFIAATPDLAGFDNLAQLDTFLDKTDVTKNAELAKAEDAFEAAEKPSAAEAAKVVLAEMAVRGTTAETRPEKLQQAQNARMLASAFSAAAETGFVGISSVRQLLLTANTAPDVGKAVPQTAETPKLPEAVIGTLAQRGVSSIIIDQNVPAAARAALFNAIFEAGFNASNAQERLTNAAPGVSVAVLEEDTTTKAVRIVAQQAEEFDEGAIAQLQAQTSAVAAVVSPRAADSVNVVRVDVDDIDAASMPALVVGATQLARNPSLRVLLFSSTGNAAKIEEAKNALAGSEIALKNQLLTSLEGVQFERTSVITANPKIEKLRPEEFVLQLKPVVGNKTSVRYDAALPLAAIALNGIDATLRGIVIPLLTQLGIAGPEADAFIANPTTVLSIGRVEPFNINILSIKLAIAA